MTGSLVLGRHGARDEHCDDQVPKVSEAFSAALLEFFSLRAGFSGWEDPPFWASCL
jgi:hypothetical protein